MRYYGGIGLASLLFNCSFSGFLVKPYFQPGTIPIENSQEQRTLIFEIEPEDKDIKVTLTDSKNTQKELQLSCNISRFNSLFYKTVFKDLESNENYRYKVIQQEKVIFEGEFRVSGKDVPFTLTVFGCGGEDTKEQKEIAEIIKGRPMDGVVYLGDFSYTTKDDKEEIRAGTATAFRKNFFTPYEDIFSKVPFYSVMGNKEMDTSNFDTDEDAYAYFDYVCHPLNGPETLPSDIIRGNPQKANNFFSKVPHFKRGSNYSVEFYKEGKPLVHLQVVDGNAWMDPSQESLQSWMAEDLKSTQAPWKIACIHQPLASCLQRLQSYSDMFNEPEMFFAKLALGENAFNQKVENIKNSLIGGMIAEKNRVREYAKVWQENGVQLVLSAHLHGYDRSKPLEIIAKTNDPQSPDKFEEKIGQGPIYVVTGAAGAHLHLETLVREKLPQAFQTFIRPSYFEGKFKKFGNYTEKANLVDYSFSSLKIDNKKLILNQINKAGSVIDTFEINL